MIISVFKTSIEEKDLVELGLILDNNGQISRWNTDLEDCDNILRIESLELNPKEITNMLAEYNYLVEELDDLIPK